ncbi:beta strand repeat-containing protein [Methylobacterium oryzisoli]|uniref:beta strand repeat-containing protein n=1 Tax=Methylobacterium oryzisoli TaxID=3385502 RepID=UPI00397E8E6C
MTDGTLQGGAGSTMGNAATLLGGTNVLNLGGTINGNLAIQAGTLQINAATGGSTLANVITGGGGLIQNSADTLTLSGANTYTGGTTVSAGTLRLGHVTNNTIDAAGTGAITVGNAALELARTGELTNLIILNGTTASRIGAATGTTATLTGNFIGASAPRIIFGSAANTGTIVLAASNYGLHVNQTYEIAGGVLRAGNSAFANVPSFISPTHQIDDGGTLDLNGFNTTIRNLQGGTATTGGVLTNAAGATTTINGGSFAGQINGAGAVTFNNGSGGTGVTTLSGVNGFSGQTGISPGAALNLSGLGSISQSGGVINNGTFDISATTAGTAITTLSGIGGTALGAQTLTITAGSTSYGGVISGTGGLTLTGGTQVLTGANTYTGATTITGGVLNIRNAAALGATVAGTAVSSGAALELQGGIAVGAEPLSLAGTGVGNGGALRGASGANSYAGTITLADDARINADAGTLTLSGAIAGSGGSRSLTLGGAGDGILSGTAGTLTALAKDGTGTWTVTGQGTFVGDATVSGGTLRLQRGGTLSNLNGVLGSGAGTAGTAVVTGTGSTWSSTRYLTVGSAGTGTGTLTVAAGGSVSAARAYLGFGAGSTGTATVTGTGSALTSTGSLYVGNQGTGTLTVAAGGRMSNTLGAFLGYDFGARGTVTVTGAGSSWTNGSLLQIGVSGTATLTVGDNGSVTSTTGFIGNGAGSTGTATVTGAGSSWANSATLYVGNQGTGTLIVQDGGRVSNTVGVLGNNPGARGTVTVTGAGSTWSSTRDVTVGNVGTGTLTIADGGTVSAFGGTGTVTVAALTVSTGTLTIGAAAGQAPAAAGTLQAGRVSFGADTGTLVFNHTGNPDGSAVTFAPVITGAGSVRQLAGTTVLTGANTYTGATTITGGVLNIRNAAALGATAAGTAVSSGAVLELQGGIAVGAEPLSLAGTGVGNGGALRGTSGAKSYAGTITLTDDARINADAGTLTLSGSIAGAGTGGFSESLALGGTGAGTLSGTAAGNLYNLVKDGTGTWTVTGQGTFDRNAIVSGGILQLQGGGRLSNLSGFVDAASSTAAVMVTGAGSTWANSGNVWSVSGEPALMVSVLETAMRSLTVLPVTFGWFSSNSVPPPLAV